LLQATKIVRLGHLGHLARFAALVNLDAELLNLLLQTLHTGLDLAHHALEDPR